MDWAQGPLPASSGYPAKAPVDYVTDDADRRVVCRHDGDGDDCCDDDDGQELGPGLSDDAKK